MLPGEQNHDYRTIKKIINKLNYKKALDLGCGSGIYSKIMKNVISLDISIDSLNIAKKHSKNLVLADARKLPFKSNSFDLIVSIEVITHIEKRFWNEIFNEINRVIKNNGYIIISIHNRNRSKKDVTNTNKYKIFWAEVFEIIKYLKDYRIIDILYVNLLPQKLQNYSLYKKHRIIYKIISVIEDFLVFIPMVRNRSLEFVIFAKKEGR